MTGKNTRHNDVLLTCNSFLPDDEPVVRGRTRAKLASDRDSKLKDLAHLQPALYEARDSTGSL